MSLAGSQGNERILSDDEMLISVKLHCHAVKNRADYDDMAIEVNFDVEHAA